MLKDLFFKIFIICFSTIAYSFGKVVTIGLGSLSYIVLLSTIYSIYEFEIYLLVVTGFVLIFLLRLLSANVLGLIHPVTLCLNLLYLSPAVTVFLIITFIRWLLAPVKEAKDDELWLSKVDGTLVKVICSFEDVVYIYSNSNKECIYKFIFFANFKKIADGDSDHDS